MEVQVQRTTVLTHPAGAGDGDSREIPLTIFDRFASNINIAILFAFSAHVPSNDQLIHALSTALLHFPLLTARLSPTHLLVPGAGALVVEATVDGVELADILPFKPSPDFLLLHPPTDGPARHLLQIQLNRFPCGGLVAAATAHHRVADGQSMGAFFAAWGRAARGAPIPPPLHDRSWLRPRSPPACEFDHWDVEFASDGCIKDLADSYRNSVDPSRITNVLLHYSGEFLAKLKAEMRNKKLTTFETLLGHLWRRITAARGLEEDVKTMMRVTVNGRQRMRPPVPSEFFGNLVLNAYPAMAAKQLVEGGTERAAEVVHEAIRRVDGRYFQSVVDFGELLRKQGREELMPVYDANEGNVLSPELEVDSWLRFGFEEVDFGGGGRLCGFLPTWVPWEGLVIFVPAVEGGGGVNAVVTLLEEHAAELRKISHSLD